MSDQLYNGDLCRTRDNIITYGKVSGDDRVLVPSGAGVTLKKILSSPDMTVIHYKKQLYWSRYDNLIKAMTIYTIYHAKENERGIKFEMRKWDTREGRAEFDPDFKMESKQIEVLQNYLKTLQLVCVDKMEEDDPIIVESWI